MELASIIKQYAAPLLEHYGHCLLPSHRRALDAMLACRKACGEVYTQCDGCQDKQIFPLSCGHRSCPKCQNSDTTAWIERQCDKLLPVPYFMVTFTLPSELRSLAWRHQSLIYKLMFDCAVDTLKTLGLDKKHLGADLGMTGVLHTHTRRLDYHPHIHFIVPGGGVSLEKGKRASFKQVKTDYLIRGDVVAKMFKGKLITALLKYELELPIKLPVEWVVDVRHIGKGTPAIKYLSRYLYRGVISEQRIIKNENGAITFVYTDSDTNKIQQRKMKGEDFIWHILMHVLPRGFRRVRDYGFLHPNAKKRLRLIQLLLKVKVPLQTIKRKTKIFCKKCKAVCRVIQVLPKRIGLSKLFPYQRR